MSYKISVAKIATEDNMSVFKITVNDYTYRVTVAEKYWHELTGGKIPPEELVRKSFAFLLQREGPGSILPEFDLPLINRYFPEYEDAMRL